MGDEPGNLPLLEHALLQLWERRQGNTITHKAYNDIESLSGALKNHADRVHDELKDPPLQDIARRIFLDLTQLGERSEDTRRRVRKADLLAVESAEAERVLKALTDARLLVVGKEGEWRETGDEMAEVARGSPARLAQVARLAGGESRLTSLRTAPVPDPSPRQADGLYLKPGPAKITRS